MIVIWPIGTIQSKKMVDRSEQLVSIERGDNWLVFLKIFGKIPKFHRWMRIWEMDKAIRQYACLANECFVRVMS